MLQLAELGCIGQRACFDIFGHLSTAVSPPLTSSAISCFAISRHPDWARQPCQAYSAEAGQPLKQCSGPTLSSTSYPPLPSPPTLRSLVPPAQIGRDNPAELKAQKLARSLTRGVIDRDLKPNSDERRKLTVVLKLPPNKPLHADERALVWRFRWGDVRGL